MLRTGPLDLLSLACRPEPVAAPQGPVRPAVPRVHLQAPYLITAPAEHWYLRKAAEAIGADRWLVYPAPHAQVIVFVDEREAQIDMAHYVEEALAYLRETTPRAQILASAPHVDASGNGWRILLYESADSDTLECEYRLYVAGTRGFRIAGCAPRPIFSLLAAEIGRALDSFRLPPG